MLDSYLTLIKIKKKITLEKKCNVFEILLEKHKINTILPIYWSPVSQLC